MMQMTIQATGMMTASEMPAVIPACIVLYWASGIHSAVPNSGQFQSPLKYFYCFTEIFSIVYLS